MIRAIRYGAADIARRSALGLAGALLLAVGLGFVTAAVWRSLALSYGSIGASLILGAIYLGLGLVCLAFARWSEPPPPPVRRDRTASRMVEAFFEGVEAGVRTRRSRRAPER